jgi:predicted methyltransferase
MKKSLILDTAHLLLTSLIDPNDIVIDATMGNGFDTLFLSKLAKQVYAFDIQKQALHNTQGLLLNEHVTNVTLIHDSHEHILNYVSDFKGVVFNLGYLPLGDKSITTTKDTTIKTLETLLPKLKKDGFILMVVYVGHERGLQESNALHEHIQHLDQHVFKIMKIELPFQRNKPPYVILIHKTKDVC